MNSSLIKTKKVHLSLAAISVLLLLSAALFVPSLNAFADKNDGKDKDNHNKHQKDRKDKDDNKEKKCKIKKNGRYNKHCDTD